MKEDTKFNFHGRHRGLPTNYALSLKRLKGLLRRLRHDPDVLREYDTVIKTQFEQGIVELVEVVQTGPMCTTYLIIP